MFCEAESCVAVVRSTTLQLYIPSFLAVSVRMKWSENTPSIRAIKDNASRMALAGWQARSKRDTVQFQRCEIQRLVWFIGKCALMCCSLHCAFVFDKAFGIHFQ